LTWCGGGGGGAVQGNGHHSRLRMGNHNIDSQYCFV
jgi:hypothetical protein